VNRVSMASIIALRVRLPRSSGQRSSPMPAGLAASASSARTAHVPTNLGQARFGSKSKTRRRPACAGSRIAADRHSVSARPATLAPASTFGGAVFFHIMIGTQCCGCPVSIYTTLPTGWLRLTSQSMMGSMIVVRDHAGAPFA
jgi:hypothetical protein